MITFPFRRFKQSNPSGVLGRVTSSEETFEGRTLTASHDLLREQCFETSSEDRVNYSNPSRGWRVKMWRGNMI